jgi:hypothetical protein
MEFVNQPVEEPWESRGEKGVGSVRLRIVEGYVFYPSTRLLGVLGWSLLLGTGG